MAPPITFRNVNVQSNSGANATLALGLNAVNRGFDDLGSAVQGFGNLTDKRKYRGIENTIDNEISSLRSTQQGAEKDFLSGVQNLEANELVSGVDLNTGAISLLDSEAFFKGRGIDTPTAEQERELAEMQQQVLTQGKNQLSNLSNSILTPDELLNRTTDIHTLDDRDNDAATRAKAKGTSADIFTPKPVNQESIAFNNQLLDIEKNKRDADRKIEFEDATSVHTESFRDITEGQDKYGAVLNTRGLLGQLLPTDDQDFDSSTLDQAEGDINAVVHAITTGNGDRVKDLQDKYKKDAGKPQDALGRTIHDTLGLDGQPSSSTDILIDDRFKGKKVHPYMVANAVNKLAVDRGYFSDNLQLNDNEILEALHAEIRGEMERYYGDEEGFLKSKNDLRELKKQQSESAFTDDQNLLNAKRASTRQARDTAGAFNLNAFQNR